MSGLWIEEKSKKHSDDANAYRHAAWLGEQHTQPCRVSDKAGASVGFTTKGRPAGGYGSGLAGVVAMVRALLRHGSTNGHGKATPK